MECCTPPSAQLDPENDWRQVISSKIMASVGKIAEVDRVYLFEYMNNQSERLMKYTKEWTADGVSPQLDRLGKEALRGSFHLPPHVQAVLIIPLRAVDAFPYFAKVTDGAELAVNSLADLPADEAAAEIAELDVEGIKALLNLPVLNESGTRQIGHIGFDSVAGGRTWRQWEKQLLASLGQFVAQLGRLSPTEALFEAYRFEQFLSGGWHSPQAATAVLTQIPRRARLLAIATANPETIVAQTKAAEFVKAIPTIENTKHYVDRIYSNTRIATRTLANPDFGLQSFNPEEFEFFPKDATLQPLPSIEFRLQKYMEFAVPLVFKACEAAVVRSGLPKDAIGQLVTVSSTGFAGPGLDAHLIKMMDLRRDTSRANIAFMGCAAAMNGLRVASDYAKQHPKRASLMVAVEISSVHGSFADNMNDIIIHSLFGDGCAAVVVTAEDDVDELGNMYARFLQKQRPADKAAEIQASQAKPSILPAKDESAAPEALILSAAEQKRVESFVHEVTLHHRAHNPGPPGPQLHIIDAMSWLVDATDDGIVLNILNDGITCTLSRQLPEYITKSLHVYVDGLLSRNGFTRAFVGYGLPAIHRPNPCSR